MQSGFFVRLARAFQYFGYRTINQFVVHLICEDRPARDEPAVSNPNISPIYIEGNGQITTFSPPDVTNVKEQSRQSNKFVSTFLPLSN